MLMLLSLSNIIHGNITSLFCFTYQGKREIVLDFFFYVAKSTQSHSLGHDGPKDEIHSLCLYAHACLHLIYKMDIELLYTSFFICFEPFCMLPDYMPVILIVYRHSATRAQRFLFDANVLSLLRKHQQILITYCIWL